MESCDVNVTWSKPEDKLCPLTMYSIYYQEKAPKEDEQPRQKIDIHDLSKTHHVFSIRCDTQSIIVEVSAWNVFGQSERSKKWKTKTDNSRTSGKLPGTGTLVKPFF